MRLIPLVKGIKLYCRRAINVGGKNYLEGQELPYKHLSLSWRLVLRLYEQRRVVSESDPYFQELMQMYGRKNNPDFAKPRLKKNGVQDLEKEPKQKPKSTRKSRVQKAAEDKKKAADADAEKAEEERNPERVKDRKAAKAKADKKAAEIAAAEAKKKAAASGQG